MKRSTVNFLLDCIAALAFLGLIATGIVIHFALPPGSGWRQSLWGLVRHQWGDVHFWLAVALGIVIVVHAAMHWTWIVSIITSSRSRTEARPLSPRTRLLSGLAALMVLAALILAFWQLSVRQVEHHEETAGGVQGVKGRGGVHIQGSMTLGEVSKSTGLPVQTIRQRLGLPDRIREPDRLARLGHEFGFTTGEARRRLEEVETTTARRTQPGSSGNGSEASIGE